MQLDEDAKSINDIEDPALEENVKQKEEGNETDPDDPRNEYSKTIEEVEDNDGENRNVKEEDKASVSSTMITIMKAMIGCGILNHPLIFRTLGAYSYFAVLAVTLFISSMSIVFLMKCKEITQRYGYSMYAKLTFGSFGTFMMKFAIVMLTFGCSCIYLRIFGDVCQSLVTLFLEKSDKFYFQNNFYVIVVFFVLMPLMFKDDIAALKKFSFIGVLAVFIFLGSMVIVCIYKFINNEIAPFSQDMLYPDGNKHQIFATATALLDSFTFQMNTFPIYLPLKPRNSKNMIKASTTAIILTGIVYALTGILGFTMYRRKLDNVVLVYFKEDVLLYKSKNIYITAVLMVCMVAFFISALLSMPIIFFALKKNLITLLQFIKKKIFNRKDSKDIEEKTLAVSMVNTQVIMGSVGGGYKYLITFIAYCSVLFCTLCVDKIITINNIVGATVTNFITMIAPTLFFMKLNKDGSCCSFFGLSSRLIFLIGFGILSTFITIQISGILGIQL